MSTLEIILADWIRGVFRDALALEEKDLACIEVAATSNPNFGDYQCNAAMPLAKTMHKAPRQIAQAVLDKMDRPEFLEKAEIAGAGFINIFLRNDWLCSRATSLIRDERMGVPPAGEGQTVILDYSSPNVAKPMHIGHIRSTIIGNAIDRMHRFLGYRVVSDNHLGDWGTQFGILIMGYRNFLDKEALERAPVEELERLYVKSYDRAKNDEAWMNACRAELVKLQAGDKENLALWTEFVAHSLREFDRIYGRLGVRFDTVRGESYYNDQLA
jgi:arginyl-tRNA synthetase